MFVSGGSPPASTASLGAAPIPVPVQPQKHGRSSSLTTNAWFCTSVQLHHIICDVPSYWPGCCTTAPIAQQSGCTGSTCQTHNGLPSVSQPKMSSGCCRLQCRSSITYHPNLDEQHSDRHMTTVLFPLALCPRSAKDGSLSTEDKCALSSFAGPTEMSPISFRLADFKLVLITVQFSAINKAPPCHKAQLNAYWCATTGPNKEIIKAPAHYTVRNVAPGKKL